MEKKFVLVKIIIHKVFARSKGSYYNHSVKISVTEFVFDDEETAKKECSKKQIQLQIRETTIPVRADFDKTQLHVLPCTVIDQKVYLGKADLDQLQILLAAGN